MINTSYNSNSRPQMLAIELSIPFIQRAIEVLNLSCLPSTQPVIIADFGSSHSLNSMYAMKVIIENLKTSKNKQRSVLVIHNDLPTNNWTILFDLLNKDNSYLGLANGRSFYEQCLPSTSLSIGYSSASLQWMSCNPCNISNHCVSLFCSNDEYDIFKQQAHLDYSRFLEYRSNELIPGGVLILCFSCLNDKGLFGFEILFQLLYKCATLLPITEQELLDYTYPLYYCTYEEYINYDLFKKFSLKLIKSELCDTRTDTFPRFQQGELTLDEFVKDHTRFLRSWTAPSLRETLARNNHRLNEDVETLLD
ncbi:unnamed protein product [Rotaria sp. Silwood1]|nr:unnamed protein product [Rotaria sp. Silwood1]CAF3862299.1 unnamed protein product [Rotaria sp. Silwood1]CAF3866563.1 unnamed protein product [Rotaria sp. Silwood1]CAF3883718.1 unnamed protein product [Rotaria sp. Silwood1]CAF4904436.1 unnamed protein product [Rotaria sp. Silwood1]